MTDTNLIKSEQNEVGRPTIITPEIITMLESVFKLGVTDEVALNYAGVSSATYYRHLKDDKDFERKMRSAQDFARIAAGQVVMKAIVEDKDVQTAKWWLEKKYHNEFGGAETEIKIGVVLPQWALRPGEKNADEI